jgi:Ni,Fe-hydrogenase I large subunit
MVNSAIPKALGLPETQYTLKQMLPSTIGRTLARCLEAEYCAEMMVEDFKELIANIKAGDTATANVDKWDPASGRRKPRAWAAPPHRAVAGPLDPHQGRQDRQLPVRGAHHLERQPA